MLALFRRVMDKTCPFFVHVPAIYPFFQRGLILPGVAYGHVPSSHLHVILHMARACANHDFH